MFQPGLFLSIPLVFFIAPFPTSLKYVYIYTKHNGNDKALNMLSSYCFQMSICPKVLANYHVKFNPNVLESWLHVQR